MNSPSRKHVQRIIVALAEYYDKSISETQLAMYTADLEDMNPADLERAAISYRRDPKNTRFPLPAALRAASHPELDETLVATDLAGRIISAIECHGYTWEWAPHGFAPHVSFGAAVVSELGELALNVIERFGGWKRLHDAFFESDRGTFNAQLRERIAGVMRLSRSGQLYTRPRLPNAASGILRLDGNVAPKSIGQLLEMRKEAVK